jgi:hypothetical protein
MQRHWTQWIPTTFILSEGHRASHETVQEHGTLMSGAATKLPNLVYIVPRTGVADTCQTHYGQTGPTLHA